MAAWKHYQTWDSAAYHAYRKYVGWNAPKYRGNAHLDCADITLTLLIDFAAEQGLPVTFWDNDKIRYISKATRQTPKDPRVFHTRSWGNKTEFSHAVTQRLQAKSLLNENTVANPRGPQVGDLMVKEDHAALVFRVTAPNVAHPKSYDKSIPVYPGDAAAAAQLNQTEYIRSPISAPWLYIDYLNHRGEGGKQKAELIYHASVREMTDMGFTFRMYKPGVIDNWLDWKGNDDPPR